MVRDGAKEVVPDHPGKDLCVLSEEWHNKKGEVGGGWRPGKFFSPLMLLPQGRMLWSRAGGRGKWGEGSICVAHQCGDLEGHHVSPRYSQSRTIGCNSNSNYLPPSLPPCLPPCLPACLPPCLSPSTILHTMAGELQLWVALERLMVVTKSRQCIPS